MDEVHARRGFSRDAARELSRIRKSAAKEQHPQPLRASGLYRPPTTERRGRAALRRRRLDAAAADGHRNALGVAI